MFVGEFKKTHNMYHHQMEKQPELGPLLHDTFDLYDNTSYVAASFWYICSLENTKPFSTEVI